MLYYVFKAGVMIFSRAYAEVYNDNDVLLTFELKQSKRLNNICRPKISSEDRDFPLHPATVPLLRIFFIRLGISSVMRTLPRNLACRRKNRSF